MSRRFHSGLVSARKIPSNGDKITPTLPFETDFLFLHSWEVEEQSTYKSFAFKLTHPKINFRDWSLIAADGLEKLRASWS
jgi:hypothetical protein